MLRSTSPLTFSVFLMQFLGFGVGDSVNDCPAFLGPYFSMALATINFKILRKIQNEFDEGKDPYGPEESMENGSDHINPIVRLHGLNIGGIEMGRKIQVRKELITRIWS